MMLRGGPLRGLGWGPRRGASSPGLAALLAVDVGALAAEQTSME